MNCGAPDGAVMSSARDSRARDLASVGGDEFLDLLGAPGRLTWLALLARPSFEAALGGFVDEHRLAVTHGVLTALRVSVMPGAILRDVRPPDLTVRAARPGPRSSMVWLRGAFEGRDGEVGFFEATGFLVGERVARPSGRIPRRSALSRGEDARPRLAGGVELAVSDGLASRSAALIADKNPIHHEIAAAAGMGLASLPLPALAVFALAEHGLALCDPDVGDRPVGMLGFRIVRPVLEGQVLRLAYCYEPTETEGQERRFAIAGRTGAHTAIKAGQALVHKTGPAGPISTVSGCRSAVS